MSSSQDQFCEHLFAEAVKTDNKVLLENKPKFLLVSLCIYVHGGFIVEVWVLGGGDICLLPFTASLEKVLATPSKRLYFGLKSSKSCQILCLVNLIQSQPGSTIIRIFIRVNRERTFPSLVCDIFSMLMGAV